MAAVPNSATAWIALSYAQQARFDLPGARQSLEKAVELAPQNALAWARLAEIQSSFGEMKLTLAAAQKAVAADPNLSRTQMVLGFAYLIQIKTTEARESPPDSFRATSTASAMASRENSGVPDGPEPRVFGGYAKWRESTNPGAGSRRTFAQVTPSARRQKTCGGKTGGRRGIFISRRT